MRRLMIGAATVGALVTGGVVGAAVAAPAPRAIQTEQTTTTTIPQKERPAGVISETLDQLVVDGVITREQADQVAAALAAALADRVRDRPFGGGLGLGFRLGSLLDDGVITAEELAQLPDDHPLKDSDAPLAEALEDGQITAAELRDAYQRPHRFLRGLGLGLRLGSLLDDGVITQEEIDGLPDGHPLKDPDGPAAEYLDDGQLTLDELRELWSARR